MAPEFLGMATTRFQAESISGGSWRARLRVYQGLYK